MPLLPLIRPFVFAALACGAAVSAHAWDAPKKPDASAAPVCSVVTVAPGDSLDALFGHTAIRIQDERLGRFFQGETDIWFDYGVFDPSDWTFWIHYAKGDAKYLLVAADPQSRLAWYGKQGRGVVEQALDLTAAEAQKLEDFLLDDLANGCGKTGYDYRFLDDNCTTRVKGAVEMATGREIKMPYLLSCRTLTNTGLARCSPAYLGANLFMGSHAEQHADVFLPILLRAAIWPGNNSTPRPLARPDPSDNPDRFYFNLMFPGALAGLLLLIPTGLLTVLLAIPTLYRWRKRKPLPTRGYLDALLFTATGAIGSLMAFLGFWSLHPELGAFNWNLIWCWPTHLLFAAGLLLCPRSPYLRLYARAAAVGAALAALAYFFVPQALPVPLFPLVLLLGLRAARWGFHREAVVVPGQG